MPLFLLLLLLLPVPRLLLLSLLLLQTLTLSFLVLLHLLLPFCNLLTLNRPDHHHCCCRCFGIMCAPFLFVCTSPGSILIPPTDAGITNHYRYHAGATIRVVLVLFVAIVAWDYLRRCVCLLEVNMFVFRCANTPEGAEQKHCQASSDSRHAKDDQQPNDGPCPPTQAVTLVVADACAHRVDGVRRRRRCCSRLARSGCAGRG
mmetsp:Transcript_130286/g.324886  ORF Transcript_130286/g.324886 Transcript_130286/m.324886 type:complete len:203 (+) Transcript_130286:911-1519(+)